MTSFLSDDDKIHLAAQFGHLHDTFARDIIVYKEAQKVIISTDTNYNYLYNNSGPTTSVEHVPQKKIFKARVFYDYNREMEYFGEANAQTKVERISANDRVRIKLKKVDYIYIKGAKRIEFDGRMFFIDSDARAHGLFDVDFYTLLLKPVESGVKLEQGASVVQFEFSEIEETSALLSGEIINTEPSYSIWDDPSVVTAWGETNEGASDHEAWDDFGTLGKKGEGVFSKEVTGLAGGTVYYSIIRIENAYGVSWSEVKTFTTLP